MSGLSRWRFSFSPWSWQLYCSRSQFSDNRIKFSAFRCHLWDEGFPHHTDTGVKRPRIVQFEIALCAAPKECYSNVDVKIMPARICDLTQFIIDFHELPRQMLACLPSILSSRCGRMRMCSEHVESLQVLGRSNSFGTCAERTPGAFLG